MLEAQLASICVNDVQANKIWLFVGCKEKSRQAKDLGDAYRFIGIERTSNLLVAWHLGKRPTEDTYAFTEKLNKATNGHFEVTTDGFRQYQNAVTKSLSARVDFIQLKKVYGVVGVQ